jgi:aquaporin Z
MAVAPSTPVEADRRVDAAARHVLLHFEETTLREHPLGTRLIVEFVGTFFLVCVAAGSGVINQYVVVHSSMPHGLGPISRTAAVVAPGAIVMAMIYALGPLSGLHINPAVTLAFTLRGVFKATWAIPYVIVQLAGAIAAAAFLQAMFVNAHYGGNYPIATPGGQWRSFVMETLLTLILVTVIIHTATGYRSIGHNAALAVGATVALLGLFASPISGASMNPARTLGPDIVSGHYTGWWVYIAGPVLGACLAILFIRLVRGRPVKDEIEAAEGSALPLSA